MRNNKHLVLICSTQQYSVEAFVAMLLRECRVLAERAAEQKIRDAIITVPPYFNQAERRALAEAADLAGINLLQVHSLFGHLFSITSCF